MAYGGKWSRELMGDRSGEGLRGLIAHADSVTVSSLVRAPRTTLGRLRLVLARGRLKRGGVEYVGVQIGPVWPHDRSELFVHAYLTKELRILAERFEDGAQSSASKSISPTVPSSKPSRSTKPSSGSTVRIRAVRVPVLMAVAQSYPGEGAPLRSPSSPAQRDE